MATRFPHFTNLENRTLIQRAWNLSMATVWAVLLALTAIGPMPVRAQGMPGGGMPSIPQSMFGKKEKREVSGPSLSATDEPVGEIRVVGNKTIPSSQILDQLQTRVGRPFDPALVQKDVLKLTSRGWFVNVKPSYERAANGRVVIFTVVERPVIRFVEYLGNKEIREKKLRKETDLKVGGPVDPYAVEEGRRKIIALYQRSGFNDVQVVIVKGDKPTDNGIVYSIHEGAMQKIWKVVFEGNEFASDGQLRTKVLSKKPILYVFKGYVDREQIEADKDRLTAYYRSFGFFQAKVGAIPELDEDGEWMTLRFVIHEGPRYDVESVSFIGNKIFASDSLAIGIEMPGGKPFEQALMNKDVAWLKELYGSQGYVFADIQAEPIFLEEPGKLKLLYKIEEGKRWRIGNIVVHINGENPHTKIQTALNRLSIRSGEIADSTEIMASERRLMACGLFLNDPARNISPKITYHIPELDETELASQAPGYRGQSPDGRSVERGAWSMERGARSLEQEGIPNSTLHATRPLGPPLIAPPGTRMPVNQPLQQCTYKVPLSPGLAGADDLVDVHVTLHSKPEEAAAAGQGAALETTYRVETTSSAPAQLPPPSSPRRYEVRRQPYDTTSTSNPYQRLTIRTQSPYQPPTAQSNPTAPTATTGYGGQAVGATGPEAAGTSPYAVRPAAYTPPQTPPPQVAQASPIFGAPPQSQYAAPAPQYTPAPQYAGPPQYAPAGTLPGGPLPVLPPDPNIAPAVPLPSNPAQAPYAADPFSTMNDPAVDLDVVLSEAQTGRLMLGVAVNSDAGLVGQILLDEQNFDWTRWPTTWDDFLSGRAWRGAGQRFRVEAAPGTEVQRYLVSFTEPYLMDTPVSLSLSGSYFDRRYDDWDEQRLGGRVGLGYQWTENDVSAGVSYRGESIKISNIAAPIPELLEVEGSNALHGFKFTVANDTRDSSFLATQGHFLQLELEQVIGSFEYPRAILEGRQYFLLDERADHTGRHVLTASSRLGFTGSDTPVYDNFFAGGYTTLRGFDFRGASPVVPPGITVGGEFMWVNTVEYLFPITADDMIHGVVFTDFGTVEEKVEIENFRVSPGFGLRITIPAMGPAPIALDFAFPVAKADFDDEQVFSFSIGLQH
jgi:outer membrane protein insertion porin family